MIETLIHTADGKLKSKDYFYEVGSRVHRCSKINPNMFGVITEVVVKNPRVFEKTIVRVRWDGHNHEPSYYIRDLELC